MILSSFFITENKREKELCPIDKRLKKGEFDEKRKKIIQRTMERNFEEFERESYL